MYYPYRLRTEFRDRRFTIVGDANGLRQLAVQFVLVAAHGQDVHLDSKDSDSGAWILESGTRIVIQDSKYSGLDRPPRLKRFRYDAKPILDPRMPTLRPNAECWSDSNDSFCIDGNLEALLSFTEHLFDLAEQRTLEGAEIRYEPGRQLLPDSIQFAFRRQSSYARGR